MQKPITWSLVALALAGCDDVFGLEDPLPLCPLVNVSDDFNGPVLDPVKWFTVGDPGITQTVTAQQLVLTFVPTAEKFGGVNTLSYFDLTNATVELELVEVPAAVYFQAALLLFTDVDQQNQYGINVFAGSTSFFSKTNGMDEIVETPGVSRYWRLVHSNSTGLISFELSGDHVKWRRGYTVKPVVAIDHMRAGILGGTVNESPASGTATFDNFRVVTPDCR